MPSITATYHQHAQTHPGKIAIQTRNETLTYQIWSERINQTANWLDSFQTVGGTLGILLPNGIPMLQLFAGASAAGWTAVLFDTRWTLNEIKERLSLSLPSILITTKNLLDEVQKLHPRVLAIENCLQDINQVLPDRNIEIDGNLPFYMGFTSGSTGKPKAFIRSHNSWVASFDCTKYDFEVNPSDHVVIPGPLIHSHFLYGAISTLYLGGSIYLFEKFTPQRLHSLMEVLPVTAVYVVPTMIAGLLEEGVGSKKAIKLISSGAKWEDHSKEQFRSLFPSFKMYEFYGASELSFVSFLTHDANRMRPGSVGRPCHNVSIQIRKQDSTLANLNETGKIFVKSPMLFLGYLKGRESMDGTYNIQTIHDQDGWITVDDMGYLDEEGFLYITGREKNMILYGGVNIFPEEIERVIGAHPDVEEAAVIGVADPHWGQIAVAVIKGNTTKLELQRWCKEKLSSVKVPRKWVFIEEMPHTISGKIARPLVKEYVVERAGEQL